MGCALIECLANSVTPKFVTNIHQRRENPHAGAKILFSGSIQVGISTLLLQEQFAET